MEMRAKPIRIQMAKEKAENLTFNSNLNRTRTQQQIQDNKKNEKTSVYCTQNDLRQKQFALNFSL